MNRPSTNNVVAVVRTIKTMPKARFIRTRQGTPRSGSGGVHAAGAERSLELAHVAGQVALAVGQLPLALGELRRPHVELVAAQLVVGRETGLVQAERLVALLELGDRERQLLLQLRRALAAIVELAPQAGDVSLAAGQQLFPCLELRILLRRLDEVSPPRSLRRLRLGLGELDLALPHGLFATLELREQLERLLRGTSVTDPLSVDALGERPHAVVLRRELGLAASELELTRIEAHPEVGLARHQLGLTSAQTLLHRGLPRRDRVDALLQPAELAGQLVFPCRERLFALPARDLLLTRCCLACRHPGVGFGATLVDRCGGALQLPFALCDPGKLLRERRACVGVLAVDRLERRRPAFDLSAELGEPRLLSDQLGPPQVEVPPLADHDLFALGEGALPVGELGLADGKTGAELVRLRLAQRQLVAACQLALVRLDLMLERIAQLLLARERLLELDAQRRELDRLFDQRLGRRRGKLHHGRFGLRLLGRQRQRQRLVVALMPLQVRAQAGAESLFELRAHLR